MRKLPDVETLADIPPRNARLLGRQVAYRFDGRDTTFAEFDLNTNRVANALVAAGIEPGDRIAYLGKNSESYFELLFGAAKCGAVMTPMGWRLALPELVDIARDCEMKLLVVDGDMIEHGRALRLAADTIRELLSTSGDSADVAHYAAWRDAAPDIAPEIPVSRADPVLQIYTSGTTGLPKGVILAHRNILDMRDILVREGDGTGVYREDDVVLIAMPIAHVGGTLPGIWTAYHGVKGLIVPQFNPDAVLGLITDENVNNFFMVPAALQQIVRDPRARSVDYSRIRTIMYGGSPMSRQLLDECVDVIGCGFVQAYGMTENTSLIVTLSPDDHRKADDRLLKSCGRPLPGVEVTIRDSEGNDLPVGQTGEIVCRCPGNMLGYWRKPEATAETLVEGGWLRTGDAGYLDENGYLYIQDRIKDMIVTGGENVYPTEVENVLHSHPAVSEVAVIGVPSERWGEEIKAIVILRPGHAPGQDALLAWVRERIAGYKVPKSVEFAQAMPRSPSGKILKRELRRPFWENRSRQVN